jgi:hypothetical protein
MNTDKTDLKKIEVNIEQAVGKGAVDTFKVR